MHVVYNLYLYLQYGKMDDNMENFRKLLRKKHGNIEIIKKLPVIEILQIIEKL